MFRELNQVENIDASLGDLQVVFQVGHFLRFDRSQLGLGFEVFSHRLIVGISEQFVLRQVMVIDSGPIERDLIMTLH